MGRALSKIEEVVIDTLSEKSYSDLPSLFEDVRKTGVEASDARAAIWQLISEGRIELDSFQPKAVKQEKTALEAALAGYRR
jgi:hypothetical protein